MVVKNRIVEIYLRLVVSIVKTRARVGYDLCECVSDGNLAMIRAVDGFDFAQGKRFSTYATRAILNVLTRNEWRLMRRRAYHFALYEESVAAHDCDALEYERARGPESSGGKCSVASSGGSTSVSERILVNR